MALLAPVVGCKWILTVLTGQQVSSALIYHLYSNAHAPAESDTLANYTEVAAAGYAAQVVSPANWVIGPNPPAGAIATATPMTWVLVGPGTVYGYYVTDAQSASLVFAELFPLGPFTLIAGSNVLSVTPTLADV